jgi:hypothetical protein
MRRLIFTITVCAACAFSTSILAQNRSAELDKAYEDTRAAYLALKDAEQRRDQGIEPQPGERLGSAAGGTRPSDQYLGRQAQLELEVEQARKRYEAAQKRWNDLK